MSRWDRVWNLGDPVFTKDPFVHIVVNEMVYYCECAHTVIHYGIKGKKVNNKIFFRKEHYFKKMC